MSLVLVLICFTCAWGFIGVAILTGSWTFAARLYPGKHELLAIIFVMFAVGAVYNRLVVARKKRSLVLEWARILACFFERHAEGEKHERKHSTR